MPHVASSYCAMCVSSLTHNWHDDVSHASVVALKAPRKSLLPPPVKSRASTASAGKLFRTNANQTCVE